jgi:exopolysaccharide production protein ExoZ
MLNQIVSIQFLRFVAAFMVVVHHAQIALVHHGLADDELSRAARWTDAGAAGVHIFFVISGFIMVLTTQGDWRGPAAARAFLARRIVRIYPFYIVCCAVYLAAFAAMGMPNQLPVSDLLLALALAPGYSEGIIGPGWTLSFEIYFYVCFAVGLLFAGRRGLIAVTITFLVCVAMGMIAKFEHPALNVLTNTLLLEFLAGAWIAVAVLGSKPVDARLPMLLVVFAIVAFVAPLAFDCSKIPTVVLWGVPSAMLILGLSAQERWHGAPRWMRSFAFLGDASYALYLMHILMLDLTLALVKALGGGPEHGIIWGAAGVAASVVASLAAHDRIERPLQKYLRRRLFPDRQGVSPADPTLRSRYAPGGTA